MPHPFQNLSARNLWIFFKKAQNNAIMIDKKEAAVVLSLPGGFVLNFCYIDMNGRFVGDKDGNFTFSGNIDANTDLMKYLKEAGLDVGMGVESAKQGDGTMRIVFRSFAFFPATETALEGLKALLQSRAFDINDAPVFSMPAAPSLTVSGGNLPPPT